MTISLTILADLARVSAVNAALDVISQSTPCLSKALSADGKEPATHYAGHWLSVSEDEALLLAGVAQNAGGMCCQAESGCFAKALAEAGLKEIKAVDNPLGIG